MYKIPFLLLLTFLSSLELFGQQVVKWLPPQVQERDHETDKSTPASLTNEIQTNRQTVFIAHLLANQVEPRKKHTYAV